MDKKCICDEILPNHLSYMRHTKSCQRYKDYDKEITFEIEKLTKDGNINESETSLAKKFGVSKSRMGRILIGMGYRGKLKTSNHRITALTPLPEMPRELKKPQQPSSSPPSPPSFDDILSNVPIETLGLILLAGFNKKLDDLQVRIDDLLKYNTDLKSQLDNLVQFHNEKLAKKILGTVTIDTLKHKFATKKSLGLA